MLLNLVRNTHHTKTHFPHFTYPNLLFFSLFLIFPSILLLSPLKIFPTTSGFNNLTTKNLRSQIVAIPIVSIGVTIIRKIIVFIIVVIIIIIVIIINRDGTKMFLNGS